MKPIVEQKIKVRHMERKDIFPALEMFEKVPDARGTLNYDDLIHWGLGKARDASIVAKIDDQVVGLLLARFNFLGIPVAEVCSIQVIFVDPHYRRQGIGDVLVKGVVDRCAAEGANTIRAFVDQKDWELKNFAENLGFKPSGIIEYIKTVEF